MKAIAVSAWRLLAVGIVSCPCVSSAELLSVTDTHPFSGTLAELWAGTGNGDGRVVAASWTQTVAVSDVSISAAISDAHGWIPLQSGTAFLTTSLGPGTTPDDEVAPAVEFYATGDYLNPPYTTLFSGIDLPPSTYYLVLVGSQERQGFFFPYRYYWAGGSDSETAVNLAAGFSLGPFFGAYNVPDYCTGDAHCSKIDSSYFPASEFRSDTLAGTRLFFRVQSVPEPSTIGLTAAGSILMMIVGRRAVRGLIEKVIAVRAGRS